MTHPRNVTDNGSWPYALELFEQGDSAFVDEIRRITDADRLGDFAARWHAGEPVLNEELDEARWVEPAELASLPTTAGLAEIVAAAFDRLGGDR